MAVEKVKEENLLCRGECGKIWRRERPASIPIGAAGSEAIPGCNLTAVLRYLKPALTRQKVPQM